MTMSYDDGRDSDERLVGIFNKYGIKGTFHLNSGRADDNHYRKFSRIPLTDVSRVYAGHEVACHTVSHPTLARCPIEQTAMQILEDRRALERAARYPVRGLSYPNGSYSKEIAELLPKLGIEYSRESGETHDFAMPEDFYCWTATCHHNNNLIENGRRFLDLHVREYLYLMYVYGHSYEFPKDGNWELMEEFCWMMAKKADIWYATNIQIVDYMKAAKNLRFTIDADKVYNPNACSVWIEVDKKVMEIPGGSLASIISV